MKRHETSILLQTVVRILIYSLLTVLVYFLIYLDATGFLGSHFDEESFTEWGQEISIIGIVLTFGWMGRNHADKLPLAVFGGGLGMMVLIREYNNFFKVYFVPGAWSVLVALTAVATTFLIYKKKENFIPAIVDFFTHRSYGLVLGGALITFCFSRLFGLPFVWEAIMKENYIRPVIRAVEEGSELMGYVLILLGVLEYAVSLKKKTTVLARG